MCYFLLSFWNVVLGREENIRGDLFNFFCRGWSALSESREKAIIT